METKNFKPFDRVLVRGNDGTWQIDFYAYKDLDDLYERHRVMTYGVSRTFSDEEILPYEGNEHLLGTNQNTDEEVMLEEGEWVIVFREPKDYNNPNKYLLGKFKFVETRTGPGCFQLHNGYNDYCIPLTQFNGGDMEETRKHILCIKNGKINQYRD